MQNTAESRQHHVPHKVPMLAKAGLTSPLVSSPISFIPHSPSLRSPQARPPTWVKATKGPQAPQTRIVKSLIHGHPFLQTLPRTRRPLPARPTPATITPGG